MVTPSMSKSNRKRPSARIGTPPPPGCGTGPAQGRLEKNAFSVLLLLLVTICGVIFRRFLVFTAVYLYKDIGSDSVNIMYPGVVHAFRYLAETGAPGWSFNHGLGQNIYPFSWNDPFFWLLAPFGGSSVAYGLAYMEAANIVTAGVLFYFYLRRLSRSPYAAIL